MLAWTQNDSHNVATYILKTVALTLFGAFIAGAIVFALFPEAPQPDVGDAALQPIFVFVGVVVLSPILETLMMWPILAVLKRILRNKSPYLIAALSAGVWGLMHSLAAWIWGLVIFWPFFLFSLCFLNWQKRSIWLALGVTMTCHALHNSVPFVAMLAEPYMLSAAP